MPTPKDKMKHKTPKVNTPAEWEEKFDKKFPQLAEIISWDRSEMNNVTADVKSFLRQQIEKVREEGIQYAYKTETQIQQAWDEGYQKGQIAATKAERQRIRKEVEPIIKEIIKSEGEFSLEPLQHAENVIYDTKELAKQALALLSEEVNKNPSFYHNHCWNEDGSCYGAYGSGPDGKCGAINQGIKKLGTKKYYEL